MFLTYDTRVSLPLHAVAGVNAEVGMGRNSLPVGRIFCLPRVVRRIRCARRFVAHVSPLSWLEKFGWPSAGQSLLRASIGRLTAGGLCKLLGEREQVLEPKVSLFIAGNTSINIALVSVFR